MRDGLKTLKRVLKESSIKIIRKVKMYSILIEKRLIFLIFTKELWRTSLLWEEKHCFEKKGIFRREGGNFVRKVVVNRAWKARQRPQHTIGRRQPCRCRIEKSK